MVVMKKQLCSQAVINMATSGHKNNRKAITLHETANTSKGAGAQSHANLQSRGNSRAASWHWQVDDTLAIQSFEHTVLCWHAGSSTGNANSIGIEVCVNSDSNYLQAMKNAWELVRHIMAVEGIPITEVKQHNFWSGKNCPTYLRAGTKGITWNEFLNQVKKPSVVQVVNPVVPNLPSVGYYGINDVGSAIGNIQAVLVKLGHKIAVDNIYGANTVAAMKKFQSSAGLEPDGFFGANTRTAMMKALSDLSAPVQVINYRVRKSWEDAGSQIGAFTGIDGAKELADNNNGYFVFDKNGKLIHPIVEQIVWPTYPTGVADRIGEVELNRDWPYRRLPDNSSEVISQLVKGHKAHLYEIRGDFYRLGMGWVYKGAADITVDYADRDATLAAEKAEEERRKAAEEQAKKDAEFRKAAMEQAIKESEKSGLKIQTTVIVMNTSADYDAARLVHIATGYPMFERAGLKNRYVGDTIIGIGGTAEELADNNGNEVIMLSGKTRDETLAEVKKYIDSL